MSSGFSSFSPNWLSSNNGLLEDRLSSLSAYQLQEEFADKPRKRIRQRVDAGLPRNAYSKINPFQITNPNLDFKNETSNLNLVDLLKNRSQNMLSYFSNPYLQTFFCLQQLKQQENNFNQSIFSDRTSDNAVGRDKEIRIQELADPNDETENEYETNRKRVRYVNHVHTDKGENDDISEVSARSSPHIDKDMNPGHHRGSELPCNSGSLDDFDEVESTDKPFDLSGIREKLSTDKGNESFSRSVVPKSPRDTEVVPTELKDLADKLKSELMQTLSETVDKIVNKYLEEEIARPTQGQILPGPFQPPAVAPQYSQFFLSQTRTPSYQSIFPSFRSPLPAPLGCLSVIDNKDKNDKAPYSFMFSRKRRTKVTDSRCSKLSLKQDEAKWNKMHHSMSPIGLQYPTMVTQTDHAAHEEHEFYSISPENHSETHGFELNGYDKYQSSTLTPMHLRKAKLIFFFARYPSSALLKAYFPDIRFNKNNTAQLVKWFSNFREYYYIQMEKFARQALAEGLKKPEEINISVDSELYRSLVQHYSRNNNYIQIPQSFRPVIEVTLREFFSALQLGRDLEASWKKSIYKIIARLDEPIPDHFKNSNFLEQLK